MIRSDARVASATTIRANIVQRYIGRVVLYLLVGFLAFLFAMPFVWMLSTAVKPGYQVYLVPPVWIPDPVTFEHYASGLSFLPFGRFTLNSLFIAVMAVIGTLISCSLPAYGLARIRWPGSAR